MPAVPSRKRFCDTDCTIGNVVKLRTHDRRSRLVETGADAPAPALYPPVPRRADQLHGFKSEKTEHSYNFCHNHKH